MRRLCEEIDSSDPAVMRAAKILSSASPLDADRFWNIEFPAQRARRPRALSLRAMAIAAMSLGSFAASAAVVPRLHVWTVPWAVSHEVAGPEAHAAPVAAAPAKKAVPAHDTVQEAPAIPMLDDDAPSPVQGSPSVAKTPGRGAPAMRAASAPPATRAASATSVPVKSAPADSAQADGESSLMVDAVRALRRDRDPARALSLAQIAMDRYPQGAQAEEAMALGMEAAGAAGDDAAARKLAERYLASFRGGHFADRAQQIVAAPLR